MTSSARRRSLEISRNRLFPATTPGSQDPNLSSPDPKTAVMPDGAEANDKIGARTIGDNG